MTAALALVTDAATTAGVIDPNESLPDDQAQYILRRFNRMIASWGNERLYIFNTYIDSLALVGGQASYSSSLLAHGNARQWDNAYVRLVTGSGSPPPGIDYPLNLVDQQTYNAVSYKATAAIPTMLYINTDWPNSTLYFFPVPFGAMTCYIGARQPLESTMTLTTDVDLPPGYEAAIVDSLAVDISPSFGMAVSPDLRDSAIQAKAAIKRNNHTSMEMITDIPVSPRLFNIYRGTNGA